MNLGQEFNYAAEPLTNVWLKSGYEISDGKWGKTIRYADLSGLAAAILAAVIKKAGRLSNAEIVYLRRKLDLSQAECANLIGVKEQTLSLWERGKYPIPISADALLRRICIEKLGKAFPKRTRFPSTESLVRSAAKICQGKYQCRYERNLWLVGFEAAFAQTKAIAEVVTWAIDLNAFVPTNQMGPKGHFAGAKVWQAIYGAKFFGVPQTEHVDVWGERGHAIVLESLGSGSVNPITPLKEYFVRSVPDGYAVNPTTGVLFSTSNSAASKEIVYDTEI